MATAANQGGTPAAGGQSAASSSTPADKPSTSPAIRLDALEREPAASPGIRLESLGKGVSVADFDERSNDVVIRRSGRVVARLTGDKAVAEFSDSRKLSDVDRQALTKLNGLRGLEPEARAEARQGIAARTTGQEAELANAIAPEPVKGRVWSQVSAMDAEVYVRVEAMRRQREAASLRAAVDPVDPVPAPIVARRLAQAAEARSEDSISRESALSAPNERIRVVPADVSQQYLKTTDRAGDRYYVPSNTKVVAFVDRGDKLETPSSAPQIAKSLVAIAESRGWEELRVRGTEGFRREVWLEASTRGIHVDGYKPSEVDKSELERRGVHLQERNSVEKRSEVFRRSTPEEGVRRDPSLAGAYGVMRQAELVAEKRLHPQNRKEFVESVRNKVAANLDTDRRVEAKLKIPEGKLVEHGTANYNFDPDEKPSYFVKLRDARGREHVQWGVGLRSAMQSAEAQPGDTIQLRVTESKGVVVEGNVRDVDGRITGRRTVDAHRNEWQAVVTMRERAAERQVEQQRVR